MAKSVYTVSKVNSYIKNMFAQDFALQDIYIKGEVSNCKYHSSGHIYFTIKDATGVLACVMFAGNRRTGLTFQMTEGQNVIVHGSVNVYERDGKYQMYAKDIQPDGEGQLYQKFEALKKELEEMGMFAVQYKQPIPQFATRIGIVTAGTGAAIQDIVNISSRRNPYVQLVLYPAQVQGEGAAASIVNGIHCMEHQDVDVIIVGRGGGSIEDLWAFNEEIVARAIFDCPIPIISAVGHETDTTISDFVADMRAPTPSAAAELAVFDYRLFCEKMQEYAYALTQRQNRKLDMAKVRVEQYKLRLHLLSPKQQLLQKQQQLCDIQDMLQFRMEDKCKTWRHTLALYSQRLDDMSPLKRLTGGYAYVSDTEGKAVRSVEQIEQGDNLTLHLGDGIVRTQVQEIEKEKR